MTRSTALAWRVAGGALVLGALADLLLRATPWSLGLFIWFAAALVLPLLLDPGARDGYLVPALGCLAAAAMMVMRASNELWVFNLAALLTGLAVILYRAGGGKIGEATPEEGIAALIRALVTCLFGPFMLAVRDLDWASERSTGRRVVIGLILAVPLLLVLGALLVGAEPVFGALIRRVLDVPELFTHAIVWGWFAWITAGFLRALLLQRGERWHPGPLFGLGEVEALTILGAMAVLFLAFLSVEARVLVGGASVVQSVTGMTYASYARSGFLELVVASGITLGTLLAVDWTLQGNERGATARVRYLSWALLAMLGLLIASAFARLLLYVSFYGLSATRLYATMAVAWTAVAAGWFGITVLRGRRGRFVFGALATVILWLAAADLPNGEAWMVQFNAARAAAGRPFDGDYLGSLSADAVPTLLAALPSLPADSRCSVVRGVQERADHSWGYDRDWPAWNLSVSRATALVSQANLRDEYANCFKNVPPTHGDH